MYESIIKKEAKVSVVGLGYVGLPIALKLANTISVIGFDINEERIELMKNNIDPSDELDASAFENTDIEFTHEIDVLRKAQFHIVAVPTPVDDHKVPDLTPLLKATATVGKALKKGDYVVFESTVYPGCTEEDCVPILEQESGLKAYEDFKVGYSPERINPGDQVHTIDKVVKVVSGNDEEALDNIAKVYEIVVKAGVHRASSIKVAEAAKIIENTQRDLNIALMNELSRIFNKLGINTYEVLEAAGTKWNFLPFTPGLVGGHCIGVDPYYLTYKSMELGYEPTVILAGRAINDGMGAFVAKEAVQMMIKHGKFIAESRALVMGATFKENVSDIRNSKVSDVINELKGFSMAVDVIDPHADSDDLMEEYGYGLTEANGKYEAIVLAVSHDEYLTLDETYFREHLAEGGVIVDIKGVLKNKVGDMNYWSL